MSVGPGGGGVDIANVRYRVLCRRVCCSLLGRGGGFSPVSFSALVKADPDFLYRVGRFRTVLLLLLSLVVLAVVMQLAVVVVVMLVLTLARCQSLKVAGSQKPGT